MGVAMLHTKVIRDLDQMRNLAFPPPYTLVESIEDTEGRGEEWWVLMAYEKNSAHANWVAVFPESEDARFYTEEDQLRGRWDSEHQIFLPEDGSPLDLRAKPVSLASIEEDEEDEDAEDEARKRGV
jgi:hypothetical protein